MIALIRKTWTARLLPLLRRLRYAPELVAVIAFAVAVNWPLYGNPDPAFRLSGPEADWLTSSADHVSQTFRETGRFPWWQPWLVRGQPAIDESFSFAANPFSIIPSLILGASNGVKAAVIISFALAGLGGWFLGWTLGWGLPARLTVAALLVLKANMQSMFAIGNFQLAVTQAYFPWILAGALALVRHRERRWPLVLLALACALLLTAGSVYYTLPMFLLVAIVAVFSIVTLRLRPLRLSGDVALLRRFALVFALTAGLMAIVAISLLAHFSLIANHVDLTAWPQVDYGLVLRQFFEPTWSLTGIGSENYYSFVAPVWWAVLIVIVLPPVRGLHQPARPEERRLWAIGLFALAWFVLWALGVNPLVRLAYDTLPYIGQWRAPERMLPVASFLLIFLLGLRLDGLYRALVSSPRLRGLRFGRVLQVALGVGLFATCGLAVAQVYQQRDVLGSLQREFDNVNRCLDWLRARYPDSVLAVERRDYRFMGPFLDHQIRSARIAADYLLQGVESDFPGLDLMQVPAQFYLPVWDDDMASVQARGYVPVEDAPPIADDLLTPCIWIKPDALPLAFSLPLAALPGRNNLSAADVRVVDSFARTNERIWLQVTPAPNEALVAVTQDIAYPGWEVSVNGEAAQVISVGRLLGVVVPPGSTPVQIEFSYTAPLLRLGGWITLVTSAFCIGFLLRAEGWPAAYRAWNMRRADARTPAAPSVAPLPVPDAAEVMVVPVTQSFAPDEAEVAAAPLAVVQHDSPPARQLAITLPVPSKRSLVAVALSALTAALAVLALRRSRERRR